MGTSRASRNVSYVKMNKDKYSSQTPFKVLGGMVKRQVLKPIANAADKVLDFYEGRAESARKGKEEKVRKQIQDLKMKGMLKPEEYND